MLTTTAWVMDICGLSKNTVGPTSWECLIHAEVWKLLTPTTCTVHITMVMYFDRIQSSEHEINMYWISCQVGSTVVALKKTYIACPT